MGTKMRWGLLLFSDFLLVNGAILGAFLLRFEHIPAEHWRVYVAIFLPATAVRLLSHYLFGLYQRVWRYASVEELTAIVFAVSLGSLVNVSLAHFFYSYFPPRSVIVISWILNILFLGATRLGWRILRQKMPLPTSTVLGGKRILIVGAGDGGALVARELRNHYGGQTKVVGFIDDDPLKQGSRIHGFPILGSKEDIPAIAREYAVDEIIISMPSVPRKVIREIVYLAQQTGKRLKILPGVFDLIEGNVTIERIRQVELEDLLGRDAVQLDLAGISSYLRGHVILVTGAGGSIGSELCRQLLKFKPKQLLLLDKCENNIYEIGLELQGKTEVPLVLLIKDIQDEEGLQQVFERYQPHVVFHAAAHKHVPLMEANPEEAIKNNVLGTYRVAWAAHQHRVKRFVLVSTDKAVNPTSVMGASKRIAEMIVQYLDSFSSTKYAAVRFGNVLGSRGSVVPLFKRQILAGGPVTVTHKDMIRYFMTIPEAVQLIIQAGALAKGGETFVLDMGEPVKIMDLATTLIRLCGYEPYRDVDIKIIGMRPGEKLFEELFTDEEGINATAHERIYVAKPSRLQMDVLARTLADFAASAPGALPNDLEGTARYIQRFLPQFVVVAHAEDEPALAETAAGRGH